MWSNQSHSPYFSLIPFVPSTRGSSCCSLYGKSPPVPPIAVLPLFDTTSPSPCLSLSFPNTLSLDFFLSLYSTQSRPSHDLFASATYSHTPSINSFRGRWKRVVEPRLLDNYLPFSSHPTGQSWCQNAQHTPLFKMVPPFPTKVPW